MDEEFVGSLLETLSGLRYKILRILAEGGIVKYSDLLRRLGMDTEKSSNLAYHLKVLRESGLIKREVDRKTSFYSLTPRGRAIYRALSVFLDEIASELSSKHVIRTVGIIERFDRRKIEASLIREAGLPAKIAREVALEAEKKINSIPGIVTSNLIREIVNNVLIERGFLEARAKLLRLGMPVYDVRRKLFEESHRDIDKEFSKTIQRNFTLTNLLESNHSIYHLHRFIDIRDINYWPSRFVEIVHSIEALTSNCRFEIETDLLPCIKPKGLSSTLTKLAGIITEFSNEVIRGQKLDMFNLLLAPYVGNLGYNEIVHSLKNFFYTVSSTLGYRSLALSLYLEPIDLAVKINGKSVSLLDFSDESGILVSAVLDALKSLDDSGKPLHNLILHIHIGANRQETLDEAVALCLRGYPITFVRDGSARSSYAPYIMYRFDGWGPYAISSEIALNLPKITYHSLSSNHEVSHTLRDVMGSVREIFLRKHGLMERLITLRRPFLRSSWLYRGERYINTSNMKYAVTLVGLYETALIMGLNPYEPASIPGLEGVLREVGDVIKEESGEISIITSNNLDYLPPPFRVDEEVQEVIGRRVVMPYPSYYSSSFVPEWLRISLKERTRAEAILSRYVDTYVQRISIGEPAPNRDQVLRHMREAFSLGIRAVEYNRVYTYCTACSSVSYGYRIKCPICGGRGRYLRRYARLSQSYRRIDRPAKHILDLLTFYTRDDF